MIKTKTPTAVKAIGLVSLLIGGFFVSSFSAQAATIRANTVSGSYIDNTFLCGSSTCAGVIGDAWFPIGTGLSGILGGIQFWLGPDVASTTWPDANFGVTLTEASSTPAGQFSDATPKIDVVSATINNSYVTDSNGFLNITGITPVVLNPESFYFIRLNSSGVGNTITYPFVGSDVYPNFPPGYGFHLPTQATSTTAIYFNLFSGSAPPLTGYVLPETTLSAFASSTVATLCDSNFATSTGFLDSVGSSISNGLCRVGAFLFVPNVSTINQFQQSWSTLTTTSFPFSWITDTRTILEGYVATTSEAFPSISIDFGSSTESLGFTTLDVISTSTISYYLPDSTRTLIKTLLASMFYLLAIGYIYRDLQSIWNKQV